ncbi:MAG: alpha/beta fold hydrolase [Pseudonocardiaceae bacterium]
MLQTEEFELTARSGFLHAQRWGSADAPLTLCVHGLSANLHALDYLAERLAGPDRQVVAFDLRGRGRSEITAPGSYGLFAHADDVLEMATALGADRFDFVGWSLGALIGITIAGVAAERMRTLTLIDHCHREEPAAYTIVRQGLNRLDAVVDRPQDYLAAIRATGLVTPWNSYWERFYAYELGPIGDRFSPITDKAACLEDLDSPDRDQVVAAWPRITMPALLLRATVDIGGGLTVPESDRDAIQQVVPTLQVAELDHNHFGIMTDDRSVAAVNQLLTQAP